MGFTKHKAQGKHYLEHKTHVGSQSIGGGRGGKGSLDAFAIKL